MDLAALGLIVAVSAVELIPNSFLGPYNWLLAGALLGRAEALLRSRRTKAAHWRSARSIKPGEPAQTSRQVTGTSRDGWPGWNN